MAKHYKYKARILVFSPRRKIRVIRVGLEVNLQRATVKEFNKEVVERASEWGWRPSEYVVLIDDIQELN